MCEKQGSKKVQASLSFKQFEWEGWKTKEKA
jgi:hypothetical protein